MFSRYQQFFFNSATVIYACLGFWCWMFRLDPATGVGWVGLTVSSLGRSLDFYKGVLGFRQFGMLGGAAVLGADENVPLVILHEQRGAEPRPPNRRGLYHFAVLYPSRRDLARAFTRVAHRWSFEGFADHLVSEALYLSDPDLHGIELYVDRPRERWGFTSLKELRMGTLPLNIDSLLQELSGEGSSKSLDPGYRLPSGTRIGHIHLHVSSLEKAEQFYHGLLGLDVTLRSFPGALFLSAGGYHHHVGANIWAGLNAAPPSENHVQLKSFSLVLPSRRSLELLVKWLLENGVDVVDGLVHGFEGYEGVTVMDFDGNRVELAVRVNVS
ncbi:glyoxalase family protein [Candidatus Caldarchaeum subterraneum]|uniref:Glyoxalase family protein n=2 Tax=Caldiarchaeum subterraneum TaxID=311458 RepID=E6N7H7_CALS0|nr:glyoxalase family protein [Candidatus Caldarchaeum subterraneum]BAJ51020.1 glyoxalase family protein [Candidatus Caldarchaeum subterraneum]